MTVMKVLGYSDNQFSTDFSASCRSFQMLAAVFSSWGEELEKNERPEVNLFRMVLRSQYLSRSQAPSSCERTKKARMGSKKVYDRVPSRKASTGRTRRG